MPRRRFDRPEVLDALRAADPVLAGVIDRAAPCRIEVDPMQSPYEALFSAIAHQQLTGKAAKTILGRVQSSLAKDGAFPSPEQVLGAHDDVLRAAGLSRAKTAAVKDLAEKTRSGHVPTLEALRRMDDDAIVEHLTEIRGIGRWTVEMLLIFRLGRPDVLPVHDYGVRKGFSIAYRTRGLPSPKRLAKHGERWRPYRTVAAWYLWRANELP